MGPQLRSRVGVGASWTAASLILILAASTRVEAAPKPITGKLTKPGYTVIALSADGRATSVVAKRGSFRLRPRGRTLTLHLRAANGTYAGPVVIRGGGSRVILGVKAGAPLGTIAVRSGYARLTRRLASRWVDRTRMARARRSVPIGAGVFGRVRSKPPRSPVAGDRDRDGIPDALDIDDDGDLTLDDFELSRTRAARRSGVFIDEEFAIFAGLDAQLTQTVNANATPATTAQADALLAGSGSLKVGFVRGDSAELDCGRPQSRADPSVGGLAYCSPGGTGRLLVAGSVDPSTFPAFPDCCDPDGDGFGTLQPLEAKTTTMVLRHGATTAQIGTGDLLIERVTTGGVETQLTTTVQYVFATVPALVSYNDRQGNAATISYPVADGAPGTVPGNGLPVTAGPNGDVIVTLTFWRPQRRPIAGEACLGSTPPCEWIDIGRLGYFAGSSEGECPQNAFSSRDPTLIKGPYTGDEPLDPSIGGFTDLAPDRPANPANTFTYSLNLTRCLAANSLTFNPGETQVLGFTGGTTGAASQAVHFMRR